MSLREDEDNLRRVLRAGRRGFLDRMELVDSPDINEGVACRICTKPTSHRKPYCSEHVTHMPYVKGILSVLYNG